MKVFPELSEEKHHKKNIRKFFIKEDLNLIVIKTI